MGQENQSKIRPEVDAITAKKTFRGTLAHQSGEVP